MSTAPSLPNVEQPFGAFVDDVNTIEQERSFSASAGDGSQGVANNASSPTANSVGERTDPARNGGESSIRVDRHDARIREAVGGNKSASGQLGDARSSNAVGKSVATARRTDAPELFGERNVATRSYTRYVPVGRLHRIARPLTEDLSVGKIGVMSHDEAEMLESKLMTTFCHDDLSLTDKSCSFKANFLRVFHLYLAINGGSIGNAAGRVGIRDDSEPLRFADVELSAVDVAAVIGDRAYAYMKNRATQIRDTIESAFSTSLLPGAEMQFPGVCAAVDLIRVVAASKNLSQYPQYVAVGSQYAAGTPPYVISAILASSNQILASTQGNVRRADMPSAHRQGSSRDVDGG